MTKTIPVYYQLFGPVQKHFFQVPFINCAFPLGGVHRQNYAGGMETTIGQGLSSGMKRFVFGEMNEIDSAEWHCIWQPMHQNDCIRLYTCDTGPENLSQIAQIRPPYDIVEDVWPTLGKPNNQKNDITDIFKALQNAKVDKQIIAKTVVGGKYIELYDINMRINFKTTGGAQ